MNERKVKHKIQKEENMKESELTLFKYNTFDGKKQREIIKKKKNVES